MSIKEMTEDERLYSSVLLVFILYFSLTTIIQIITKEETQVIANFRWTISFLLSMIIGTGYFLKTRPTRKKGEEKKDPLEKNIAIIKKALKEDEKTLVDMIKNHPGVTQDSIRFKTGYSKSKVSALITDLEKKDIITRETMGRTYRLHIAEWLKKP